MTMQKAVTKESAAKKLAELKKGIKPKTKERAQSRSRTMAKKVAATRSLKTEPQAKTKQELAIHKLVSFYAYTLPDDFGKPKKGKKGKAGGRPSVITPDVLRKLEYAFAYDCTVEEACILSGIYPSTYYDFVKVQPKFSDTVALLRNIPVLLARKSIVNSVIDDPEKALKYLERKKKTEFSPKLELGHGGEVKHTHDVSPEAADAIENVVALFENKAKEAAGSFTVSDDDED